MIGDHLLASTTNLHLPIGNETYKDKQRLSEVYEQKQGKQKNKKQK
jgi:hypothetical protein